MIRCPLGRTQSEEEEDEEKKDDAETKNDMEEKKDKTEENLAVAVPDANAYEFQSHGVIEMLEKLLDKFIERTTLENEETNARHAFEMLSQDLKA